MFVIKTWLTTSTLATLSKLYLFVTSIRHPVKFEINI